MTDMVNDVESVTFDEVDNMVDDLVFAMETNNYQPDKVIGIERGGLVPAIMISHRMNAPLVSLRASFRDYPDVSESVLESIKRDVAEGLNILIVDDINDTGKTLKYVTDAVNPDDKESLKTAVLFEKNGSELETDFYAEVINNHYWVLFPWEAK